MNKIGTDIPVSFSPSEICLMRGGITKVASAMVAAALACSIVPATSLAVEQQSSTVPVANAQQTRDAAQISIDVPSSLDFASEGALVIQEKDAWGSLTAAVPFKNQSDQDLYISSIKVEQQGDNQLNNLYSGGSVAMSFVGQSDSATASVSVESSSAVAFIMPDESAKNFMIAKNGNASFNLIMDGKSAVFQDDDTLKAEAERGDSVGLASIVWTFAVYDEEEAKIEEYGGFFLLDGPTKKVYGVEEVKAHAVDIERNGTSSPYYLLYLDYARGARDYTCRYAFKKDTVLNPDYKGVSVRDMKIIGVNHDIRVDASGNMIGRAGLTFWIEEVAPMYGRGYPGSYSNYAIACSWEDSLLRKAYQPSTNGGTGIYYDLIPDKVKQNIVPVFKQTYSYYSYGGYNHPIICETSDYAFALSAVEVGATAHYVRHVTHDYDGKWTEEGENEAWPCYPALEGEAKMSKYEHDLSYWPFEDEARRTYRLVTRTAMTADNNDGTLLIEGGWKSARQNPDIWPDQWHDTFSWHTGGSYGYANLFFGMAFCF